MAEVLQTHDTTTSHSGGYVKSEMLSTRGDL